MNFNRNLFKIALIGFAALVPVALVLRLFTYGADLEPATGFFLQDSITCVIYNVIGFLVFGLTVIFSQNRKGSPIKEYEAVVEDADQPLMQESLEPPVEEVLPELHLNGFAKCACLWEGTLSAFASFLPGFGMLAYALAYLTDEKLVSDPYNVVFALLSLLSGAYFILYALINAPVKSRLRPFFALVPAFWCTVRLVIEYRDLARFVNKALYVGQFLFVLSALLFFLYQAQLLLGEKPLTRPNSYAFSALGAAFFGLTARLPQLIAVAMDRVSMDAVDASGMLMDLAITFFVCVKIQSVWREGNN